MQINIQADPNTLIPRTQYSCKPTASPDSYKPNTYSSPDSSKPELLSSRTRSNQNAYREVPAAPAARRFPSFQPTCKDGGVVGFSTSQASPSPS